MGAATFEDVDQDFQVYQAVGRREPADASDRRSIQILGASRLRVPDRPLHLTY